MPRQIAEKAVPGPDARVAFEDVAAALEEFRSVTIAAAVLGVTQPYLSHYLAAKHRKPWWIATKARWRVEAQRDAARRGYWKRKHASEPPPLRYAPKP